MDERKPQRRADGTLIAGTGALNPGGRPAAFKEYQHWLTENALDKAKDALLSCLIDDDGKTRLAAVKEVCDRLFGRAPQVITGADGKPLGLTFGKSVSYADMPDELLDALERAVKTARVMRTTIGDAPDGPGMPVDDDEGDA